jgi:hypothetical protein
MEFSIKFLTEHHNFFERMNIVLVRSIASKFFEGIVEDAIASS